VGKSDLSAAWSHPSLSEPVTIVKTIQLQWVIRKGQNTEQ